MDKNKILKMIAILAAIVIIASGLSRFLRRNSLSLSEYARLQGIQVSQSEETPKSLEPSPSAHLDVDSENFPASASSAPGQEPDDMPSSLSPDGTAEPPSQSTLTGASLNGNSQLEQRVLLADRFYYEPLSVPLCRYITGVSYPASDGEGDVADPSVTLDELRYVHILHYDFEGNPAEGELICNELIAQDLVEIFYELYRNEYQLEKVLLIDEYDGDDEASMADNNTSCFNYRPVTGSASLSKHALGLAIDINPLYNPYITYAADGGTTILPDSAAAYADRTSSFPYKIDEDDLCYKLFTQHGFTWGGNWNNVKDYQHFQKAKN